MSRMIYRKPAKRWKEALPLGNGSLGAMVYGGIKKERISLNDATLWSGYPRDYDDPNSAESLNVARELIFDGKNVEADAFVMKNMGGEYSQSFLPLADLTIRTSAKKSKYYSRVLDLNEGVLSIKNGNNVKECFVSYPSKAMYYKMTFSSYQDVKISFKSKLRSGVSADGDTLIVSGNAPDNVIPNYVRSELRPIKYNESKGMAFGAGVKAVCDGEILRSKKSIVLKRVKNVVLKIVTATGFVGYDKMPSTDLKVCEQELKNKLNSLPFDYEIEKTKHTKDFSSIYKRQELNLCGQEQDVKSLLDKAKRGYLDTYLVNLLYDYGKYMTLSGSRDSQPLNLQGLWNRSIRPPWSSNLTTNINYEMNYWATAACSLDECLIPFYKTLQEIAQRGEKTARVNYGADGFCCNHNVDIWRMTSPVKGNPAYMYAPLCGVWIANEAYAHNITQKGFADKSTVEIIEQAAKFCLDYMTERNGELVTCPSASPEAEFMKDGKRVALDYASAFEMGLIMQCFDNALKSSQDKMLKDKITSAKILMRKFTDTSTGINEWHDDKNIAEKGHRHFSPLYALYPAKVIGYYGGKDELIWSKKLFDYRMSNSSHSIGWSAAWAICIAARLHDGERAYSYMKRMTEKSLFPNLFGYHPPIYFQIDGNLGFVAGVNEMLFYEEDGVIDVLPACPSVWSKGSVKGHKIIGATVDMKWKDGKVVEITADKPIKVRKLNIDKDVKTKNVEFI